MKKKESKRMKQNEEETKATKKKESKTGNQVNLGTTRDQIMSERKRRQLMAERFIAFSSIIPGLKVSA